MKLYFFHLKDGVDLLLDPEGRRLPSLDAVAAAALFEAREIVSADAKSGAIKFNQYIEVEDEAGAIVHRLHLKNSVTVDG
jgi:hypothetical protein